MLNERDLNGIYVPVITPFLPNEELDLDSYRSFLSTLLTNKIQGLVINGTTGESPTVSWEEVAELVQSTKDVLIAKNRKLPIIIGTGTNATASTVKRTELAGNLGADAVLVVIPYYNRPSQAGILEHFRRVSEAGMPVIAYEVPSRTGVRLTVDTTRKILDLEGVIGLKDSSGGVELIAELSRLGETKPILCGDDFYFHEMLLQGARGAISASANVDAQSFLNVFELFNHGDTAASKKAFDHLVPLIQRLFQESNPSPLKWLLAQQGVISSGTLRLPMSPITKELQLELEQAYPSYFKE